MGRGKVGAIGCTTASTRKKKKKERRRRIPRANKTATRHIPKTACHMITMITSPTTQGRRARGAFLPFRAGAPSSLSVSVMLRLRMLLLVCFDHWTVFLSRDKRSVYPITDTCSVVEKPLVIRGSSAIPSKRLLDEDHQSGAERSFPPISRLNYEESLHHWDSNTSLALTSTTHHLKTRAFLMLRAELSRVRFRITMAMMSLQALSRQEFWGTRSLILKMRVVNLQAQNLLSWVANP
jgi:hypothetical protein